MHRTFAMLTVYNGLIIDYFHYLLTWQQQLCIGKVRFLLGWGGGRGFLVVLSFLMSWPPPPPPLGPAKDHLNMCDPLPISPYHSWYYWSLLTSCLRIVTHCHHTVAKHWISLSLCYQTNLKWLFEQILHSYFCQEAHLCQFQFWKITLWRWPDVLKRCD